MGVPMFTVQLSSNLDPASQNLAQQYFNFSLTSLEITWKIEGIRPHLLHTFHVGTLLQYTPPLKRSEAGACAAAVCVDIQLL